MAIAHKAFTFGAILMFAAVGLGAFGAHALDQILIDNGKLNVFSTANEYHFYHALGLLIVGVIFEHNTQMEYANIIINLLFYGVILFSGSLYLLAITNISYLGAITPIGGLFMLVAWLLMMLSLKRLNKC